MRAGLPYLYEGEILDVVPQTGANRKVVRYLCRVELDNGSSVVLKNVESATLFGGIADYAQIRHRTSKDAATTIKAESQDGENSRIGDRVLISFIGGSISRPMIVGCLQHPNQSIEIDGSEAKDLEPQAVLQYLGIRATVDKEGQLTLIHQGAPVIKEVPTSGLGDAAGAIGALLGATNPSLAPAGPAIEPAAEENTTLLEFLNEGVFRIRDADGQMIEIDRTRNRIYISNNDLKSTEDPATGPASGGNQISTNSTDAEYVLLDKAKKLVLINARSIAQIYSADRRKDVTEGNHSHKIGGNTETTVGGDLTEKVIGAWTVESAGDVTLIGGKATLKLGVGKVGLGGPAGELLDLIVQALEEFGNLLKADQAQTHIGNLGYATSPPVNLADYAKITLVLKKIKANVNLLKGGI